MVVIAFLHLYKIHTFSKFGGSGFKFDPATPLWSSKLKWAWQVQFLSHNLQILKNCVFSYDNQMILVPFLYIFCGDRFRKLPHSCGVQGQWFMAKLGRTWQFQNYFYFIEQKNYAFLHKNCHFTATFLYEHITAHTSNKKIKDFSHFNWSFER